VVERHLGEQPLESPPAHGAGSRQPEIIVDDQDALRRPSPAARLTATNPYWMCVA